MVRFPASAGPGPICGIIALAVYFTCVGPAIGPGDSAELTLAALKLGIAHPPGYPLFLWLGRIAAMLSSRTALAVNLLTALLSAAAVTTLYYAAKALGADPPGATVAALLFAFSRTFWFNATSTEVYGLSMLFLALCILLAARTRVEPRLAPAATFIFGLALAHQPSALFWLPGVLALSLDLDTLPRRRALLLSAGAFLLGLSSALGTMVRALTRPSVNWGDPSTFGRFLTHATARQYSDLAGSAPSLSRLAGLPRVLVSELGVAGVALALVGFIGIALAHRRVLLAVLLLATAGTFGLTYNVPDFRVQLLPSLLALCLATGVGVSALAKHLGRARPVIAICLIAPLLLLIMHLAPARESRTTAVQDLGANLLRSLPYRAVFIGGGDVPANATRWLQQSAGNRHDITVIAADMLFSETYVHSLPELLPDSRLPSFRELLAAAGTGPRAIRLQGVLAALCLALTGTRPIALSGELLTPEFFVGPIPREWQVVPRGIVYELITAGATLKLDSLLALDDSIWRSLKLTSVRQRFSRPEYHDVQLAYTASRNNLGMFCVERGRPDLALPRLELALTLPGPTQFRTAVQANLARARTALSNPPD